MIEQELCVEIPGDYIKKRLILYDRGKFSHRLLPGPKRIFRPSVSFLWEHVSRERLLKKKNKKQKNPPKQEQPSAWEGGQMFIGHTLSHLPNKRAKSQGRMLCFAFS